VLYNLGDIAIQNHQTIVHHCFTHHIQIELAAMLLSTPLLLPLATAAWGATVFTNWNLTWKQVQIPSDLVFGPPNRQNI